MVTPDIRITLTYYPLDGTSPTSYGPFSALGWEDAQLVLERDEELHSMRELFESSFLFSGGAYDFIKDCEAVDGPDTNMIINAEVFFDEGAGWEILFSGILSVKDLEDETDNGAIYYKLVAPLKANNLWTKFVNRFNSEVNLFADTDLDGRLVDVLSPKTQNLPAQAIRQRYEGALATEPPYSMSADQYAIIDFDLVELNEIATKNSLLRVVMATLPPALFTVKYGGDYDINLLITTTKSSGVDRTPNLNVYVLINDNTPIAATKTNQGVDGSTGTTKYEFSDIYTLVAGDEIRIYFKGLAADVFDFIMLSSHSGDFTTLTIDADTLDDATSCQALLTHDVGYAIVDRIVGQIDHTGDDYHKFYSPFLGRDAHTARTYDAIGDGSRYALTRGNQVRGNTLGTKPWYDTFKKWYEGMNNILMLGCGVIVTDLGDGDKEYIIVNNREYYYNPDTVAVTLINVRKFIRHNDLKLLIKAVAVGYPNAECEEPGVFDDVQGVDNYNSRLERSGEPTSILSPFLAAGMAIEATKRKRIDKTKDWRFDNTTVIIANETIGDVLTPELDEHFTSITGINNSDTRYNLRLWPVYNFIRHLPQLIIGLAKYYSTSYLKFSGGNLNTVAASKMDNTSEDLITVEATIAQDDDIAVALGNERGTALHGVEIVTFDHPLAWENYKLIRDNQSGCIAAMGIPDSAALSTFDATFDDTFQSTAPANAVKYFIKRLSWKIKSEQGNFLAWKAV